MNEKKSQVSLKLVGALLSVLFWSVHLFAGQTDTDPPASEMQIPIIDINDGPHVLIQGDSLIEKSVVNGEVVTRLLEPGAFPLEYATGPHTFEGVSKMACLSDIHGQYDLAVELLQNNGIIKDDLSWNFGKGHLVIVGDIFDRGDKVTETLWLIYNLEQEAEKSGGKVHLLLGNHEFMVLQNDLRYIHQKYVTVQILMGMTYYDLYGPNSVMGRWLRTKPTVLKINNDLFVHGGISTDFIGRNFNLGRTNKLMRESLEHGKKMDERSEFYKKYYGASGPIWYRGYFFDNLPDEEIVTILKKVNSDHIIVGHCSQDHVVQLYDHKIFGVDSSIKLGEYGEVLLIKKDSYARGTLEGEEIEFEMPAGSD